MLIINREMQITTIKNKINMRRYKMRKTILMKYYYLYMKNRRHRTCRLNHYHNKNKNTENPQMINLIKPRHLSKCLIMAINKKTVFKAGPKPRQTKIKIGNNFTIRHQIQIFWQAIIIRIIMAHIRTWAHKLQICMAIFSMASLVTTIINSNAKMSIIITRASNRKAQVIQI